MKFIKQNIILFLVASTFFIEMLDGSILVTSTGVMASYFSVNVETINFAIVAYVSSFAAFLVLSPWLATKFGEKNIFIVGIIIFTIASLFCGLSENIYEFFLFEIIQGFGAAIMSPIGRTIALKSVSKDRFLTAISLMVWPGLVAPLLGPILGAWITVNYSWPWMFYINIPIGIVLIFFSSKYIPLSPISPGKTKFDFIGAVLFISTVLLTILCLNSLLPDSKLHSYSLIIFIVSIILLVITFSYLRKSTNSIIDLECFKIRRFKSAMGYSIFFRITTGALPFLLPMYYQEKFGLSLIYSASLLTYMFAGNLLMKIFTTGIIKKFNITKTIIYMTILQFLTIVLLGSINFNKYYIATISILFIYGATRSILFQSYMSMALIDVPKKIMSHANAINSIQLQLTMGMGLAFYTIILVLSSYLPHIQNYDEYQTTLFIFSFITLLPLFLMATKDILKHINPLFQK